ncbi:MAG: DUF5667 domain-containing protein [Dehalococcoidales bacterium]
MKHRLFSLFLVGVVLGSLLFAGAAYARDDGLPSPGITPDSPLYFFDKIGKSLSLAFTFGSEAKARKSLRYAQERLSEAQKMASENKTAALEQALADFEKYIALLQAKLADIKQQVASDNISESAALALIRQMEVLEKIKDEVPDKDRKHIDHAANVTMDGQASVLRALGKDKPERAFDICDNITQQQLEKVRAKCTANVTAAKVTAELDYAERISDLEDEMADIAAATGANVTALQERLAHSTVNRLDVLSGVYEKVPENARPAIASAIENSVDRYARVVDKLDDKNVASVNATISKMPVKLQPSLSNHASAVASDRSENKPSPKPVTASANQTRPPETSLKPVDHR